MIFIFKKSVLTGIKTAKYFFPFIELIELIYELALRFRQILNSKISEN